MSDLVQKAQTIWETEDLCNRCLGRCFAKLGTGLTNEERGAALRVIESMTTNALVSTPSGCSICSEIFDSVDDWAHRIYHATREIEFRHYLVGTRPPKEVLKAEEELWARYEISDAQREPFKQEFNRLVGKRLGQMYELAGHERTADFREPEIVLLVDLEEQELQVTVHSIFIYGRYRKLIRTIPQTEWPCRDCKGKGCVSCDNTGKQYPESVGELIAAPALESAGSDEHAFHGAGREDIDALMLGPGRPFVLEIKAPAKRTLDLEKLSKEVNRKAFGKVEVGKLRFVKRSVVELIKEQKAQKSYRALVDFGRAVSPAELRKACGSLVGKIDQRTPNRVLHRRADLARVRELFNIESELKSDNCGYVTLTCDGGLYVKELISGDDGRTTPSLASFLSTTAVVRELDVLSVDGDFPD